MPKLESRHGDDLDDDQYETAGAYRKCESCGDWLSEDEHGLCDWCSEEEEEDDDEEDPCP